MEYKAVRVYRDDPVRRIAVLNIGVDRVWRHLEVQHLILPTETLHCDLPLVTKGYVHWLGENFVLTLNVETEAVCWFYIPHSHQRYSYFLAMGSNLSHIVFKSNEFFMDVWDMNPQTGEWTWTYCDIDLKPVRHRYKDLLCKDVESITPVSWLNLGMWWSSALSTVGCIA